MPAEAIRTEGTQSVVFVYAADRVQRRAVTLGPLVGGQRQLLTGVRDGEQVVLSPPASLRDGDTVTVGRAG